MSERLRLGSVRAHAQWAYVRLVEELPGDLARIEYVEPVLQRDDTLPKVVRLTDIVLSPPRHPPA